MTYLLDTHVLIWLTLSPDRLGHKTKAALSNLDSVRYLSAVSTMELSRLIFRERVRLPQPLHQWLPRAFSELLLEDIPFTHAIAMECYALPGEFHADPCDRELVATARVSGCTLVTADEKILAYPHVQSWDACK
jgi:PIN domain nuclease of toxin-antitoxin system